MVCDICHVIYMTNITCKKMKSDYNKSINKKERNEELKNGLLARCRNDEIT